jgi:hypothetical protein
MRPDLTQYEDAATLNKWFINNFPLGRIDLAIYQLDLDKGIVVFLGSVYRDLNDAHPAVTNFAKGERDDYPAHMRKWYLEDTATSAIARCLTLLKGSNKTAHKESMIAATSWSIEPKAELDRELLQVNPVETLTREVENLRELHCDGGVRMLYKAGLSKTTNKPFAGYVCVCGQKCPPVWGIAKADGTFVFRESISG